MKKFLLIFAIAALFTATAEKAHAQTQVVQPFSMLDSTLFSTIPYKAKPTVQYYYMVQDSLCYANKWSYTNYFNDAAHDTVRFLRQRRLMIYVANSAPVGSITVIVHKDSTGTINAAKVYLEASNDGINWVRQNDTMTCTNIATNSHTWVLPNPIATTDVITTSNYNDYKYEFLPYLYYEIIYVGVSTSKADIHAFFVPRHRSTAPN